MKRNTFHGGILTSVFTISWSNCLLKNHNIVVDPFFTLLVRPIFYIYQNLNRNPCQFIEIASRKTASAKKIKQSTTSIGNMPGSTTITTGGFVYFANEMY